MAIYRTISISFWTDPKVDDSFTPEDKYFYLYLLTNPHVKMCGCYEISMKQIIRETGYAEETIQRLLSRMQNLHDVIRYDAETKEILLLNWHKYNWSASPKVIKAVKDDISMIKNSVFKEYLIKLLSCSNEKIEVPYCIDTVSIGYPYSTDTSCSGSDRVGDRDSVRDSAPENVPGRPQSKEELLEFCNSHNISPDLGKEFYDRYDANGWTMDIGEPVRIWKNVILSAWRKEKNQSVKKSPGKSAADPMEAIRARRKRERENTYTVLDIERELNRKEEKICG